MENLTERGLEDAVVSQNFIGDSGLSVVRPLSDAKENKEIQSGSVGTDGAFGTGYAESVVSGGDLQLNTVLEPVPYDDSALISNLEQLNTNIYLILLLALSAVAWVVIKNVYKVLSMLFGF